VDPPIENFAKLKKQQDYESTIFYQKPAIPKLDLAKE
jgi:hypothetical protein